MHSMFESSQNFYVEALISNMTTFGDRALTDGIKIK